MAAPPPVYTDPLAASYCIKPPEFVDEPFPEIANLDNYYNSYLEGVIDRLNKSIKSITGQLNLDQRRVQQMSPADFDLYERRRGYKQSLMDYKGAFIPYLNQRRKQAR